MRLSFLFVIVCALLLVITASFFFDVNTQAALDSASDWQAAATPFGNAMANSRAILCGEFIPVIATRL